LADDPGLAAWTGGELGYNRQLMDIRDRIDAVLATKGLDNRDFERRASHSLKSNYPRLTPIAGGTDLGRDADIVPLPNGPRMLATVGPRFANLKRGLSGWKEGAWRNSSFQDRSPDPS